MGLGTVLEVAVWVTVVRDEGLETSFLYLFWQIFMTLWWRDREKRKWSTSAILS